MKLLLIKLIHTLIWAFMAACVILVLFAGILGFANQFVWWAIGAVFLEGVILLVFRWRCPLTIIAQKYTHDRKDNFDIFLPEFLARHNKIIFTTIFGMGLLLIFLRKVL